MVLLVPAVLLVSVVVLVLLVLLVLQVPGAAWGHSYNVTIQG